MQIPDDLDALTNAAAATAPCVFILPGADHLVPPRYPKLRTSRTKTPLALRKRRFWSKVSTTL
jgi:hypothetical protein